MKMKSSLEFVLFLGCFISAALPITGRCADVTPPASVAARTLPPTRLPNAPGTPVLTLVGIKPGDMSVMKGTPGVNPPVDADGDFLIGPDYVPAPELTP